MSSMHAVLGRILGGDTRESAVAYPRVRLVRVDDRREASVRADGRLLVPMAARRPRPHRRCPRKRRRLRPARLCRMNKKK